MKNKETLNGFENLKAKAINQRTKKMLDLNMTKGGKSTDVIGIEDIDTN